MNSHPLSGRTPEEAARVPPDLGPKPKPNAAAAVLSLIAGVVLALTVALYTQNLIAALGSGCGLFGALVLLTAVFPFLRAKKKRLEREEELIRHRADQVAAYTILYRNTEDARAAARDASAAHEAAASALEASRGQILAQIRSYRPLVKDMGDALQAVTAGLAAHDELDQARRAEEAARLRDQVVTLRTTVDDLSEKDVLADLKKGARKGSAYGNRKNAAYGSSRRS